MRSIQRGAATIYFDTWGDGPPVLALAPGGLRASRAATWQSAPINPLEELSDQFRVVGMDQRNTGTSFAPITAEDGWSAYVSDQLAVMDELGFDRFGVIGMCIGGAFIMRLIAEAPERILAAVALQPIGLDSNRHRFREIFDEWRGDIAEQHPEADEAGWERCWSNLFGGDHVLFSVPDAALPEIKTPILVCQGNDAYHPAGASHHLAAAVPGATLIERWKEGEHRDAAVAAIRSFFTAHLATSAGAAR